MLTQRILPTLRHGVVTTALLAGFASTAFADKVTLTGHTDYRDGVGGEFNIRAADAAGKALLQSILSPYYFEAGGTAVPGADGTRMYAGYDGLVGFQTFCLEYNEFIALGETYNAQVSYGAINGGVGGWTPDPDGPGPLRQIDPVSLGSAYLYTLFATGTLSGYDYSNGMGRAADAEQLQKAIWFLEDERTLSEAGGYGNEFLSAAVTKFGSVAGAKANNNSYNVGAINLWSDAGVDKQSQLIMRVPDGGVTALLLGFGLSGLALLRRKAD